MVGILGQIDSIGLGAVLGFIRTDIAATPDAGTCAPLCERLDATLGENDSQVQSATEFEYDQRIAS